MIEEEAKLTKEVLDLMELSASIFAAMKETFEEKSLTNSYRFFVMKNILLLTFKDYDNWMEVADFFFKDVRESMERMDDYEAKGTTTLQ